jgi:hypothetical protein
MAMSHGRWKDRVSDLLWGVTSGPGSTGIYIAVAMSIAGLASAKTGIPGYALVAAAVVLVLFIDPSERIRKLRRQRRQADVNHRPTRSDSRRGPAMGPGAKLR